LEWALTVAREPLRTNIREELTRREGSHVRTRPALTPQDRAAALHIVKHGFRQVVKSAHPDAGGTHTEMVALNRANEWLLTQIG
jgi:hypothetical protein